MSCGTPLGAIVNCVGVQLVPTSDPYLASLQQQVCALQALSANFVSKQELEHVSGALASHTTYASCHFADRCVQESTLATLAVHKDNLSKTLAYTSANHNALAQRTEILAQASTASDRAIWGWVSQVETMLQSWQQFESFRMTQVTAINADAACRAESDFITAQQAIAAISVSTPSTISNAVSAVLNLTINYIRGADLKALRNREFITTFGWGGFAGVGVNYGFGGVPGTALVGAFGLA